MAMFLVTHFLTGKENIFCCFTFSEKKLFSKKIIEGVSLVNVCLLAAVVAIFAGNIFWGSIGGGGNCRIAWQQGAGTPGKSWADKKFVIVCQFSTKNIDLCENFNPKNHVIVKSHWWVVQFHILAEFALWVCYWSLWIEGRQFRFCKKAARWMKSR